MTTPADDELWSAIAGPSRRRVLDLVVSNGDVSASWLAGRMPFSRQAVARHLGVLERAGLVSRRKQGRALMDLTAHGRQEVWEDSPPGWPRSGHLSRADGGAPGWPRVSAWPGGRPTAQWPRLAAGRRDDLGAGHDGR